MKSLNVQLPCCWRGFCRQVARRINQAEELGHTSYYWPLKTAVGGFAVYNVCRSNANNLVNEKSSSLVSVTRADGLCTSIRVRQLHRVPAERTVYYYAAKIRPVSFGNTITGCAGPVRINSTTLPAVIYRPHFRVHFELLTSSWINLFGTAKQFRRAASNSYPQIWRRFLFVSIGFVLDG